MKKHLPKFPTILSTLTALALHLPTAAADAPLFSVTLIQSDTIPLGPGRAINNAGLIVTSNQTNPILWQQNATAQSLPQLPNTSGNALAINASGDVAGISYFPDPNLMTATLWINGQPSALPPLPGDTSSVAYGINNNQQVVGASTTNPDPLRAVLWQNNIPQDLSPFLPQNISTSNAVAINNSGQILITTDQNDYLLTANTATEIAGNTTGAIISNALSDRGQVAGVVYNNPGAGQAFIWSNGKMNIAPPITTTTPYDDEALAINNNGIAVGFYLGPGFGEQAFIWDGTNPPVDLNSLIDLNSGWQLALAWSINDSNQIVGLGYLNGIRSGFLLTPTPEPTSFLPLVCAALPFLTRRRPH